MQCGELLLLLVGVGAALGHSCHHESRGTPSWSRGPAGWGRVEEGDDPELEEAWRREYQGDPEEDSDSGPEIDAAAAGSDHILKSSKRYQAHGHAKVEPKRSGYGNKRDYGDVKLSPGDISVVCTVKSPLEHIIWLRSACPDEYERGEVIARGADSLLPDLFEVSVSGADGEFTSTLLIKKPREGRAGGVFRCEAWPHFSEHRRHRREVDDLFKEDIDLDEVQGRQGRAHHDPWNAIILGGAEYIEECFYGHGGYERQFRNLEGTTEPRQTDGYPQQEITQQQFYNQYNDVTPRQISGDLRNARVVLGAPQQHVSEGDHVTFIPAQSIQVEEKSSQDSINFLGKLSPEEIQFLQQIVEEQQKRLQEYPRKTLSTQSQIAPSWSQSQQSQQPLNDQRPRGIEISTNMIPLQGMFGLLSSPLPTQRSPPQQGLPQARSHQAPSGAVQITTNMLPADQYEVTQQKTVLA